MTKIERMDTVLRGEEPDRPPVSLWYHFGLQHLKGADYARIALDYFNHYDFDFLKLMNDQYYPLPPDSDGIASDKELLSLGRVDPLRSDWREHLQAVKIIAKELKRRAYFVDTVFDPWQTLSRNLCGEHLADLAKNAPRQLQRALRAVTENLIGYCRASLQNGANGIFLSIPASREHVDRRTFLNYVKPAAMKLLTAIRNEAPFNIVHLHGDKIFIADVLDFPVPVLSWEDRLPKNPGLDDMKLRFPGVVMGGIDHTQLLHRTLPFIKRNAEVGINRGGKSRFILAGGCSIPSEIYPAAITKIVETAKAAVRLPDDDQEAAQ